MSLEHPVWGSIAFIIFISFMFKICTLMINDKNAVIRFIGYAIATIIVVGSLLFALWAYLGVKFF